MCCRLIATDPCYTAAVRVRAACADGAGAVHAQAAAGRQGDTRDELGTEGWRNVVPRRDSSGAPALQEKYLFLNLVC